jgi:hypothetical protein
MPVRTILLQAMVGAGEAPAVSRAAELIAESLEGGVRVEVAFLDRIEAMDATAEPRLLVTSLLGDAGDLDETWADCERRVRNRYAALVQDPGLILYVCTIFRHIGGRSPRGDRALARRIRGLNLLAANLSREIGLIVADFDRALADLGGAVLRTDWRLGGPHAAEACAACLASVVLQTGLDGIVSAVALDSAARSLASRPRGPSARPAHRPLGLAAPGVPVRSPAGRQTAEVVSAGRAADVYLRGIVDGTVPMGQGLTVLRRAIHRRGLSYAARGAFRAALALLARRPPRRAP